MKKALTVNAKTGKAEKMSLIEALQAVTRTDPETMSRFMNLNNAIRNNNNSLYEIAYYMNEININKDSVIYGYKTTAEMIESMFGYKKASTSKMLSVARNFLYKDLTTGEIKSKFSDKFPDGFDAPMTCMYELLLDKDTMKFRSDQVVDFYREFPLADMRQSDYRELQRGLKELLVKGLPMNATEYEKLMMSEQEKQEKNNTEQKQEKSSVDETEQKQKQNTDSMDAFKLYLGTLSTIINGEENAEKKAEMVRMLQDVLKMHKQEKNKQEKTK